MTRNVNSRYFHEVYHASLKIIDSVMLHCVLIICNVTMQQPSKCKIASYNLWNWRKHINFFFILASIISIHFAMRYRWRRNDVISFFPSPPMWGRMAQNWYSARPRTIRARDCSSLTAAVGCEVKSFRGEVGNRFPSFFECPYLHVCITTCFHVVI